MSRTPTATPAAATKANQALAGAVNSRTNAAAAPAQRGDRPQTVFGLLADPKIKQQMALALPRHLSADRMLRIAMTEARRNPKLAKCNPQSFVGAVMQCAQLGLEPGGVLGHAYLLPFDKRQKIGGQWQTVDTECQLIIGYRGMIDLARRSGQIVSISARCVHENDDFVYSFGLDDQLEHIPAMRDRGAVTFVYAVAKLRDGGVQFEVMSRDDIEQVRAQSKAANDGPWVTHWPEMAKKTVARRLFKWLPVSIELARAVALDEAADYGGQDNALALDGEFSVVDDALANADPETGEIPQPGQEPTPAATTPPLALEDALHAVRSGDFDLALDLARSLTEHDAAIVEQAVEQQQRAAPAN